jgi:hypothetical protein
VNVRQRHIEKREREKVKNKCPIEGHIPKLRGEFKQRDQDKNKEHLSLVSIFQLVGYLMRVKINILSIH